MRSEKYQYSALTAARHQTDSLFDLVRPDSLYARPIPERHRLAFYIGHLEAFDWNLLARHSLHLPAFDASLDRLFAFGIDPPPGQLPSDTVSDWPDLHRIEQYVQRVRQTLDAALDSVPDELLHVAVEHRLMHAETLAYILHQLPYSAKLPPPHNSAAAETSGPTPSGWIGIPSGDARLGRTRGDGFGWDNEFDQHTIPVSAFRIREHKVTNGEYLEFVREGAAPPFFWTERGGLWFYRGMFAEVPLPLDAPVYVTLREAEAYARRHGAAIPDEPQFHRAACGAAVSSNLDFRLWDPVSVYSDDQPAAPPAPRQMVGNGWEWTSTPFAPFPGFRPFDFYPNYSEPFFDGRHFVLKGASPRTASCFLRASFRNWFRPEYPYIYATFRMVQA
jgi:gamma-glutamyl hercynylcysteine S-oxide synthase